MADHLPTSTTRRLLVVPDWPKGMPDTTTIWSPELANPSAVACSVASAHHVLIGMNIFGSNAVRPPAQAKPPGDMPIRRHGQDRHLRPLARDAGHGIAAGGEGDDRAGLMVSARSAAAVATAWDGVVSISGSSAVMIERYTLCRSVVAMIRSIIETASTGYFPDADSADSMTASAPS